MWPKPRSFVAFLAVFSLVACEECRPDGGSSEGGPPDGVSTTPVGGPGGGGGQGPGGPAAGGGTTSSVCLASATRMVSVYTGGGTVALTDPSFDPSTNARGTLVAFTSLANLAPSQDDQNQVADIYLHNTTDCTTRRISVTSRSDAATGDVGSTEPAMSASGNAVAFTSTGDFEPNLTDQNGVSDIYVADLATGEIERVSVYTGNGSIENDGDSYEPSISADGTVIAFTSRANLAPDQGDTNGFSDVYVHNRTTNVTRRVSVYTGNGSTVNDGDSYEPSISGDGNLVVFTSRANLAPDQGDTNGLSDIYIHDISAGATQRVSVYSGGGSTVNDGDSYEPSISTDGTVIAFTSRANLQPDLNDVNGVTDVYIHILATRETQRVSVYTGGGSTVNDGDSYEPSISDDGTVIAFTSRSNLQEDQNDNNGDADIYIHNADTGVTQRVSVYTGSGSTEPDGDASSPAIASEGGLAVTFASVANLQPDQNDNNGVNDVYIHR